MKQKYIYLVYIALGLGLFYNATFGAFVPISSPAIGNNAASNTVLMSNGTTSNWMATSSLGFLSSTATTTIIQGNLTALLSSNSTTTLLGQSNLTVALGASGVPTFRLQVQGKFAYITTNANNTFETYDVSTNTPALISVFTNSLNSPYSLSIRGNYAYIGNFTDNKLLIVNISNPSSPVLANTVTTKNKIYVSHIWGHYLYLGQAKEWSIYDIANPINPSLIFESTTLGNTAQVIDIFVDGEYAYVIDAVNSTLKIYNISIPSKTYQVSSTATNNNPSVVIVQGKFAYVGTQTINAGIQIFDIANKNSPSSLFVDTSIGTVADIKIAGRFLFTLSDTVSNFKSVDISSPATTTILLTTTTSGADGEMALSGRRLFIVNGNAKFQIFDFSGIEATAALIHSLRAGVLRVDNEIYGKDLFLRDSLSVGPSGIGTLGSLAVSSTGTPSIILGGLYVGTTSPATTSPNFSSFQQSVMVVEATSTGSVPLTLRGSGSQLGNLFQVQDSTNANLFYLTNSGGFLTTASSTVGNRLSVTGLFNSFGNINASSTATSTFAGGIQLYGTGNVCLSNGTCIGGGSGTLTGGGVANQLAFWNGATSLAGDSQLYIKTSSATQPGSLGIGTSSPYSLLSIQGQRGSTTPMMAVASSSGRVDFDISYNGTTTINQGRLGILAFEPDGGVLTAMDMSVLSAANNTNLGYNFMLDASTTLMVYGQSDGNGNIKNQRIGIASSTPTTELAINNTGGGTTTVTVGGSNMRGGIQLYSANGTAVCVFADNSGVVSSFSGVCE